MAKPKRKLTAAQRRARRERREKYMTIFVHGKQKRVLRPPTIDGMSVDEFIARNADEIWLHQAGLWELIPIDEETTANKNWGMSDEDPMVPEEDWLLPDESDEMPDECWLASDPSEMTPDGDWLVCDETPTLPDESERMFDENELNWDDDRWIPF